ncbi:MAG: hypothetical protein HQ582_14745 [Planctomycetes bacterium]|nr:hypothetical protein [Planctomycetota bacterium]
MRRAAGSCSTGDAMLSGLASVETESTRVGFRIRERSTASAAMRRNSKAHVA